MLKTYLSLLAIIGSLSWNTSYAALTPQLGLWESTSEIPAEQKAMFQKMPPEAFKQMQQSGMKVNLSAGTISNTFCINQEQLSNWHQMGQKSAQQCDKPQISDSGNVVKMNMVCHQPHPSKMQSIITFNAARDAYQFEHLIQSEQHSMTLRGRAKRLGDCK
ncbi:MULTISPECIES: DUF3617 domain-containing protein [Deefgea]|nr:MULTISPECIES: DUF3617 family protein [Deefgea]MBM9888480.1 DUF3617 family protein [Deefgea sp. CFH1-16]